MRQQALWAIALLAFSLSSCKKNSEFEEGPILSLDQESDGEIFDDLIESDNDVFEPLASQVDTAPSSVAPVANTYTNTSTGFPYNVDVPLAGPSVNSFGGFPPVRAVPPDAYGDDGIDDFFNSPRVFGVPYSICGNGNVESKEHCDDGNFDNTDGCNVLCCFPRCGNGLLEEHEECDDNNNTDDDGCTKDCIYEYCGNGKIDKLPFGNEVYEECDDGNKKAGDGCSPCCLLEKCGNNLIDKGEECDDGNTTSGDGCSDCCKLEVVTPPPT